MSDSSTPVTFVISGYPAGVPGVFPNLKPDSYLVGTTDFYGTSCDDLVLWRVSPAGAARDSTPIYPATTAELQGLALGAGTAGLLGSGEEADTQEAASWWLWLVVVILIIVFVIVVVALTRTPSYAPAVVSSTSGVGATLPLTTLRTNYTYPNLYA
ncbi:Hypothetical protein POVN_LOCUS682 [uncultured virus]|nr:Hypothetical protein POVN_LOCUS682 [uncultured virus]